METATKLSTATTTEVRTLLRVALKAVWRIDAVVREIPTPEDENKVFHEILCGEIQETAGILMQIIGEELPDLLSVDLTQQELEPTFLQHFKQYRKRYLTPGVPPAH
jgi:hypothetical protein